MRETLAGRSFINLFELERLIKTYPGIEDAEASLEYGENNLFYVKASLKAAGDIEKEALQQFVTEKLGKFMAPEIITVNGTGI